MLGQDVKLAFVGCSRCASKLIMRHDTYAALDIVCMPGCALGATGWRCILRALATIPHIQALHGLASFVRSTSFDPTDVLRGLQWPVTLLQQPTPVKAILQFCRELSIGKHMGDPVASLLLLGPEGAGKSTLLHRLQTRTWKANFLSTDGLCIGASGVSVSRGGSSV